MRDAPQVITAELLLHGYAAGVFPMARSRDALEIEWIDPRHRGIMPLDGFHMSRSLAKSIRRANWRLAINSDFANVVAACADRDETWINSQIFALYLELHRCGFAHSVEVWEEDALVGGLYGVSLGGAFFGESMFSRQSDASKFAMASLVARLRKGGYTLLDTQFLTPHLASLGGIEISRRDYRSRLAKALQIEAEFNLEGYCPSPSSIIASLSA